MIKYSSQLFNFKADLCQFCIFQSSRAQLFKANQLNFKETLQASITFSPPLRKGQVE